MQNFSACPAYDSPFQQDDSSPLLTPMNGLAQMHAVATTCQRCQCAYSNQMVVQEKRESDQQQQEKSVASGKEFSVKKGKGNGEKSTSRSLKRRVEELERRVEELQRENASLRRNQHQCQACLQRRQHHLFQQRQNKMMVETPSGETDQSVPTRNRSTDSIEFQQVNLHFPLLRSPEMQEKLWIFLGMTLIAMGSKVMDWDGTINTFKLLKDSVDDIRRQVGRCDQKVSLQFFCSKQEIKPSTFIDGVDYNPFFEDHQPDPPSGAFLLDHVKLESVQRHDLIYDSRYEYSIDYEALLTIMQYAKDYCSVL